MKTYSTYQEAKIENPECEIAERTQKAIDEFDKEHCFAALVDDSSFTDGYAFADKKKSAPRISDGYWKICNPADYCMTVEEFLSDGNKFVDGDLIIGVDDCVWSNPNDDGWDYSDGSSNDRYILRAAALENKESDYDRGMREAMQAIAKSCGRTFAVDVGYADLPALVESMVNPVKKTRTRVEYVKCDFDSTHDAYYAMLKGVELFSSDGMDRFKFDGKNFIGENGVEEWKLECHSNNEQFYRKVETEIDERQEFIDAAYEHFQTIGMTIEKLGKMFDSGLFKYIGGDDADK